MYVFILITIINSLSVFVYFRPEKIYQKSNNFTPKYRHEYLQKTVIMEF